MTTVATPSKKVGRCAPSERLFRCADPTSVIICVLKFGGYMSSFVGVNTAVTPARRQAERSASSGRG